MREQKIIKVKDNYLQLDECLLQVKAKHIFLVCGSSINLLSINQYFEELEKRMGIEVTRFMGFQPNPEYESVVEGVKLYKERKCDVIMAVGGGSAMDVAKCIKLYSNMNFAENYLVQRIVPNDISFFAVPTTAGTGSEATRYAVIYYKGEKQSITEDSIVPSVAVFDASVLESLPLYQRKVTMLDAFCHAIESYWSVNSTDESKGYSQDAIKMILKHWDSYLQNEASGNESMLKAANLAGKAINITQTTAGHAMCYKLTSLYGIPHGQAAAMCVSKLWPYMMENIHKCIDPRGKEYLIGIFKEIAEAMGCKDAKEGALRFQNLFDGLELTVEKPSNQEEYVILSSSVNVTRLKNNPVELDAEAIRVLYYQILSE